MTCNQPSLNSISRQLRTHAIYKLSSRIKKKLDYNYYIFINETKYHIFDHPTLPPFVIPCKTNYRFAIYTHISPCGKYNFCSNHPETIGKFLKSAEFRQPFDSLF